MVPGFQFATVLLRQTKRATTIRNTITTLRAIGKEKVTEALLKSRLARLEKNWEKFQDSQLRSLSTIDEQTDTEYFTKDIYSEIETCYDNACDDFANFLAQFQKPKTKEIVAGSAPKSEASTASTSNSNYKLPRIEIPSFSGDYADWTNFKRMFESLVIKNANLSSAERFHYLLNSVSGDASAYLHSFDTSEEDFDQIWNELKLQYEHERFIIQSLLSRLYAFPVVGKNALVDLKSLNLVMQEIHSALKSLDRSYENDFFVFFIITRFDTPTRREWEIQLGDENEFPTYEKVNKFVRLRIKTLEALKSVAVIQDINSSKPKIQNLHVKAENSSDNQNTKNKCRFCKGEHKIYSCSNFKALGVKERDAFVRSNYLCFNCLGANHAVKMCRSNGSCSICKQRHHSLLHFVRESREATTLSVISNSNNSVNGNYQSEQNACDTQSNHTFSIAVNTLLSNSADKLVTLLPTVKLRIRSPEGRLVLARALLDQGSQKSFITENMVQLLRLRKKDARVVVFTLEGMPSRSINKSVDIFIEPIDKKTPSIAVDAVEYYSTRWYCYTELSTCDDEPAGFILK